MFNVKRINKQLGLLILSSIPSVGSFIKKNKNSAVLPFKNYGLNTHFCSISGLISLKMIFAQKPH